MCKTPSYMDLPPGHHRGENILCRLNKSLYGLNRHPEHLYSQDIITHHLLPFWFILLIYVDDILLTHGLLQQFRIKDLGDFKYFLGIEFPYQSWYLHVLNKICSWYFAGYGRCLSKQIFNRAIPKTHHTRPYDGELLKELLKDQSNTGDSWDD